MLSNKFDIIPNMVDNDDYRAKVARFIEALQPSIDAEKRFYDETPIGTKFWVPCSGIESLNRDRGHVGKIVKYIGKRQWEIEGWVTQDAAKSMNDVGISSSDTLCASCNQILSDAIKG